MSHSLIEQAGYWRRLEAGTVSLVGPQLDAEGLEQAQRALAAADVVLESIVHPFSQVEPLNPDKGTWRIPRDKLSARIDEAKLLGARSIYMTTGGHGGLPWEQAADVFSRAVAPCVDKAQAEGVKLMIENSPFLYADLHIAHTLRDTLTLAEMAGVGICIDLFGCWAEADLENSIWRAMPLCNLVQVSDYVCGDRVLPSRAVPGDGNIPLERLLGWILDAGYRGVFELELIGPRIEREGAVEATERAADAVGELLRSLGVG